MEHLSNNNPIYWVNPKDSNACEFVNFSGFAISAPKILTRVTQFYSLALWERVRVRGAKFNLISPCLTSPHLGRGIVKTANYKKNGLRA